MLDARRLRLLRELAVRGTIGGVAEALSYSPSHVSQQLAILEREAGVPLLRRQGRGVQFTSQGEVLVEHARGILDRLELAEREVRASLGSPSGTVRMAVFQSAALALVPRALEILVAEHPALRVEMVQHEPESALVDTSAGDYDLVVAEQYPGHAARHEPGLDRRLLTTDALMLAVAEGSGIRSLAEAADTAWVMEPVGAASRHYAEQRCRVAGFEPDVRYETADLQAQLRLVASGHGACIVNELTVGGGQPGIRLLPLPGLPRREIFTATRRASAADLGIAAARSALARAAEAAGRTPSRPN